MAVYATAAQAAEIYGTDYVTIACDRDGDGVLDSAEFDKQLSIASREIDAYLLGRYALPLANPPEHLQKVCVDLAIYNSSPTGNLATDLIKDRRNAAIDFLEKVAANRIKLETASDATDANTAHAPVLETKSVIEISGGDRQFQRDSLKGLL